MKVIAKLSAGKRTYSEDVTSEQKEYFKEISTNGANKDIEGRTFEWWTRPIKIKADEIEKFNTRDENAHFIFGWFESFGQSNNVPEWIYEAGDADNCKLIIEVINEI